ncbi:acetoin dehydrogenase [Amycolatopsis sp. WAC 01375]|uniref:SDR family NAD(P)-dependent oxidoreductase n=1 Tax=unclassified Amycolatopsis TaxID=2618356 RepID=UPI000F79EA8C|nr:MULTISPECIES: SDR family NAD(P)-dependent oxidoreductase [unclassified Amycolatopsis]RSM66109.1 acetoin dehydrogenase [Amycolatopsis sp. WAC 01376]RSM83386.1 acetoin dehydrogenase [Amycolatopsis sp. WAC 01375]RSN35508.1 acetoin dehydrogenase [Amycolatopsis sp. WAC 01416]
MRSFTDKVVVITGAGSGIGKALAIELAGRGARLALSDVDAVRAAGTVAECETAGATAKAYALDVADRDAVLAHAEEVAVDFGGANVVVNNAGVALGATVEEMTWDDYDWLMGINLGGVVNGTKAFLPQVIASGDGHIVNLSSVFGFIGVPTQSAYNAAKFAVRGFTEALRQEMLIARHPVKVSCVHPGGIKTNIARDARGGVERDIDKAAEGFEKIARTTPEKAAQTIVRGIERGTARILIGPDAYAIDAIPRVLGSFYQRPLALLGRWGMRNL